MEVHAHTHTARKKWTHYLWEFLMLFLAVFCGFLAENFREHQLEHHREKEYMESLVEDLKGDTSEITKSLAKAAEAMSYEDSEIYYLYKNPPADFLPNDFLQTDGIALQRLKIVFVDITSQQLKNAGNFRLIRNKEIVRKISLYWTEQENTIINLERYLEYRNRGRQFAEQLFAFSDNDLQEAKLIDPAAKGVRVIQSNTALWSEYSNILSHCNITALVYSENIKKALDMAKQLLELLKKEYHLK